MSIFNWAVGIKITFDRPIITPIEETTGFEEIKTYSGLIIKSNEHSTNKAIMAFDRSNATYWQASSTSSGQWLGLNFEAPKIISKIRVYMGYSSGRINGYIIQGSNDGSSWEDIINGNFTNASSWQEITFDAVTYQYFRLYCVSKFSSYYTISEIEFYEKRPSYNTTGWEVLGQEPNMSPNGVVSEKSYSIRKIERVDDNYAIIIWLELSSRLAHPQNNVTVNFTGTLQGPGGSFVAPFSLSFVPSNLSVFFNPNNVESFYISSITIPIIRTRVYYVAHDQIGESGFEIVGATVSITRTHIDDLEA